MTIKQPRRFVTTDQGHADVLNVPIDTLYENDQSLDEAIKNIKVDDATTTVKGIVRLSADYKSASSATVPNSKALSDLYGISFVDRGKPFSVDWNFIILPGAYRIDVATLNPASDHSPPGANPKGVLFVGSVKVEEDMVIVHLYVDETGGVYKRIRTVAGVWVPWDGLASKNHTHLASDLPSASTQARGITQLNTSTNSTATDQAATPSAVKVANDRANEAYSRADQAFTQAVDLKNKIVGAINGKGGSANTDMTADQIVASLNNMPVKKYANGNLNLSISGEPDGGQTAALPAVMTRTFQLPTGFNIGRLFIRVSAYVYAIISMSSGWNQFSLPSGLITVAPDAQGDISNTNGSITVSLSGTTVTVFIKSGIYSGAPRRYEAGISLWWAIE